MTAQVQAEGRVGVDAAELGADGGILTLGRPHS